MAPLTNKEIKANKKDSQALYSYIDFMIQKYPELQAYADDVQKIIDDSPTGKITYAEVARLHTNPEASYFSFWDKFDGDQEAAELLMAKDQVDGTTNYADSIQPIKAALEASARTRGLNIDDATLTKLAGIARYENFSKDEIENALRSESRIDISQDLTGAAGTFQTELETWSAKNGLQIPSDVLSRLVQTGAFGDQGIEDMKQQLRDTYLKGTFPGWEKEIAAGADPYDLAAPYIAQLASTLELNTEDISFDDDLLSQAMQTKMTITDLKREARKDPRWDKTENALKTYADAGTSILAMFGLR
jgi:hypothetical protein